MATSERSGKADRPSQLLCIWSGPAATLLVFLGLIVIGGFVPAQSPSASGKEIADFYSENATQLRVGMLVAMIGFTLLLPFGIAIATLTRQIENRPFLSNVQIACVAVGVLEGVLSTVIWATAAFRPADIGPDITRMLNDLGWFMFLFDWPPFSVWLGAIGIAILRDDRVEPLFPRWAGYLNLWVAFLIFPAGLMAFFKTGPFGFNGLLALYEPVFLFFAWVIVMTTLLITLTSRETRPTAARAGSRDAVSVT